MEKDEKLEMNLENFQRISNFRLIHLLSEEKELGSEIRTELENFEGELEGPERKYIQSLKEEYCYPKGNTSLDTPLKELGFMPRIYNAARRAINKEYGIEGEMYLGDLVPIDKKTLWKTLSVGKKTAQNIEDVVKALGYKLGTKFNYDRPVSE